MAADNLPALRVDPALLGPGKAQAGKPATGQQPPPVPAAEPGRPAAHPAPPPETVVTPTEPEPAQQPGGAPPAPDTATPPPHRPPLPAAPAAPGEAPSGAPAGAVPHAETASPPAAPSSAGPTPGVAQEDLPTFITADRLSGRVDEVTQAEGNAELRKGDTVVQADRLTHRAAEDEVEAEGNVRVRQGADLMTGPKLRLKVNERVGEFEQPRYAITRPARLPLSMPGPESALSVPEAAPAGQAEVRAATTITGAGRADRLEFQGEGLYRFVNATYSTCTAEDPDWYAQAEELKLDYNQEVAQARHAKIVFKDTPILYSPWLEFSLNNQRKSGFLTPTFGTSTTSGIEAMLPYYWNIAPNMDATIAPRLLTRRGVQLNTEYRYLEHDYAGQVRLEYMPDDRLFGEKRWGYSVQHNHRFPWGLTGMLNLNRVSDATYFRDLSTRVSSTSQSLLLNQGLLHYGGSWWTATANVQRYQALVDPSLPALEKPYDRLPQLTFTASRPDVYGTALNFAGEFVAFDHDSKVQGRRLILYPQASFPWQTPSFYVTPKIGYHVTRYNLSQQAAGVPDTIDRNIPIFSVDSGVAFEREITWAGRALTQTLEPRLYYLYVPTRQQDQIPVFDTAAADLNFASLFSENLFVGGDRIADANQITAAITSRLIEPSSGREIMRAAVGQRLYFKDQEVGLPGMPLRTRKRADILTAFSGEVLPRLYADAGWQYNPRDSRTEKLVLAGRYQPEPLKVLNLSYRYTRDVLGQIDASGQWPLRGGWYGVGRYNYSLKESRVIETIGGLEYDGGCWAARFVVQRLATTPSQATTAFFVQLELNGLARLGSNPLDMLKRSVPGYGVINEPTADPHFAAR